MESIVIAAAAVFAISYIVSTADGMFGMFYKLRKADSSELTHCFTCLSVWFAALFAIPISNDLWQWILSLFAIAGIAMFAYRIGDGW